MNTYNENLNSIVVSSLATQEVAQTTIDATTHASMFTLYYAEGQSITAAEKLDVAEKKLAEKTKVKTQAVDSSNVSNNQLGAANQANDYVKQAVTNTSVAAANVQTASNAIVRLAGDIGNIFSIVNAADFGTDIYDLASETKELINITAYNAEIASRVAMEASTATAEVSIGAVMTKSTGTNTLVNTLLSAANTDYDNASDLVNADNDALATSSAQEKLSEGEYLDNLVEKLATDDAYSTMNDELNLDLKVEIDDPNYPTAITISFDRITNPFDLINEQPHYPVEDYKMVIVKNSRKSIFSLSNADIMYQQESLALYPIDKSLGTLESIQESFSLNLDLEPLIDSDGDALEFGTDYVVFIMAIYTDEYKWKINNYDNFLTAPSEPFTLLYEFEAVDAEKIRVFKLGKKTEIDETLDVDIDVKDEEIDVFINADLEFLPKASRKNEFRMNFEAPEDHDFKIDYRCIFLLHDPKVNSGLMTTYAKGKIEELEDIAVHLDPDIEGKKTEISGIEDLTEGALAEEMSLKGQVENLTDEITALTNEINSSTGAEKTKLQAKKKKLEAEKKGLEAEQVKVAANLIKYAEDIVILGVELAALEAERAAAIAEMGESIKYNVDFLFNAELAEQVAAGNYTPAVQGIGVEEEIIVTDDSVEKIIYSHPYHAYIGDATTDNFGNQLMKGKYYIPVVLCVSGEEEENRDKYKSVISMYELTTPFKYSPIV